MRIATWNIGGSFVSSRSKNTYDREDINYFIEELKSINPDIVCFQEIHVSRDNDQSKILSDSLGLQYLATYSIADSHLKDGEKLSISIISKFPILSSILSMFPNPHLEFIWRGERAFSHDKGFVEAIVNYNGIDIRILSGHMLPFRRFGKDFLADEFTYIRDKIEHIILETTLPTVVGADMNFDGEINTLIPDVIAHGFKSILPIVATTPTENTYDKIIVSKEWECNNSVVVEGRADHFLCFADVEYVHI